jgi:exodeoxyribonuclease V alpha subunit
VNDAKNSGAASLLLKDLEGVLERLTYQNDENGYTVARLVPTGKAHEVTVVGTLSGVNVGETLLLRGTWTTHPNYGRQFEIHTYTIKLPATIEGIRKYLGSGLIKGIGPVTAARIVDTFGLDTLDVIESAPERLKEVPGIAAKRIDMIARAWEEQKFVKEIMLLLQSLSVSPGLATRIFKTYGEQSIQIVRSNPYRLAKDIFGIGFKTADRIARQLGLPPDAPMRIQTGLTYTLSALSDEGHCFAFADQLVEEAARLLEVAPDLCRAEIETLRRSKELIVDQDAVYLPPFFFSENGVASKLRKMLTTSLDRIPAARELNWSLTFQRLARTSPIQLTAQQQAAIQMALSHKVTVLTGGPGTGKSTIIGSLIRVLQQLNASVLLAAPTGRAAKRLSETTGLEAKTIHRLLEFSPSGGSQFARDRENPLDADMIIIDETSMVDILLMNHLLNAIDAGSHLLLVGDQDQLPSVGPGNVLRDLIRSDEVPVTRLDTIFRQAADSFIITNAHRINQGEMPEFSKEAQDFFLFSENDPAKAAEWVLDLVGQRIPDKFGFDSLRDIQVLAPMYRGSAGVAELNDKLQAALNPPGPRKPEISHSSRVLRLGDRVMQIRNDYDKLVFNGDLGLIAGVDLEASVLEVDFEGRAVTYEWSDLDELVHAYAVSIHKSQGSEFPVVVIPILTQHFRMLQRNLLYTAVTRARKLVVLVGNRKAISLAVRNNLIAQRNTRLADRLRQPDQPDRSGYLLDPLY